MWSLPLKISVRKFKTLDDAKERVSKKYPTAFFVDATDLSIIYVGARVKGMIRRDNN